MAPNSPISAGPYKQGVETSHPFSGHYYGRVAVAGADSFSRAAPSPRRLGGASSPLPERPGEQLCKCYAFKGVCKYGSVCKFDHIPPNFESATAVVYATVAFVLSFKEDKAPLDGSHLFSKPAWGRGRAPYSTPAYGIPARYARRQAALSCLNIAAANQGQPSCPYYMRTGTCKFGTGCKFNHPTPGEAAAQAVAAKFEAMGDRGYI